MTDMEAILDFQSQSNELFLTCKSPRLFLPSFKSISLYVQEKKLKMDFQDGHYHRQLEFPFWTILAIFDLQITQTLPTKFQVVVTLNFQS